MYKLTLLHDWELDLIIGSRISTLNLYYINEIRNYIRNKDYRSAALELIEYYGKYGRKAYLELISDTARLCLRR